MGFNDELKTAIKKNRDVVSNGGIKKKTVMW